MIQKHLKHLNLPRQLPCTRHRDRRGQRRNSLNPQSLTSRLLHAFCFCRREDGLALVPLSPSNSPFSKSSSSAQTSNATATLATGTDTTGTQSFPRSCTPPSRNTPRSRGKHGESATAVFADSRYRDTLHAKPEACCPVFYFRAIKKHFNSRLLAQQDAERRSRSRPRSRPTPSASPRVATRPPGAAVPVPYRAIVPAHWEVFQRRLEKDVATKVAVFGHRRGRGTVPITPRLNLVPLSNGACCSNPTRKAKQILMAGVVDPIVRDMFPGAKIYVK